MKAIKGLIVAAIVLLIACIVVLVLLIATGGSIYNIISISVNIITMVFVLWINKIQLWRIRDGNIKK